ncbi:hypothetical protein EDC04DRAFT_2917647 [Pisolithus marmoratus]|nr:hypothetical protein EDC04DRAFT_2917647 [Pisolithus marmoratus]
MASTSKAMLSDQKHLSTCLKLLEHMEYFDLGLGDLYSGRSDRNIRDRDSDVAIRVLDTIAVALTTGVPGEVVAAAFDNYQGRMRIILAKNAPATQKDLDASEALVNPITAPATETALHVLPTLLSHCRLNIEKRIKKMLLSLSLFTSDLELILDAYTPLPSIEEEFPDSGDYRTWKYGRHNPPFLQMIRDLLKDIELKAEAVDYRDTENSAEVYVLLAMIASVLQRSRLFRLLCDATDPALIKQWAGRLDDRISKVCQYCHGVNSMIDYAERHFPRGIKADWVSGIKGAGEARFVVDGDCVEFVSRVLGGRPSGETLAVLHQRCPDIEKKWKIRIFIKPRLHAEIRIILYLDSLPDRTRSPHLRPVGCSKRSCLCCALWIQSYNNVFKTKWLTSGTHGKPYSAWALPGSLADEAVLAGVDQRLVELLLGLRSPISSQRSDDHRSTNTMAELQPTKTGQAMRYFYHKLLYKLRN